MMLTELATVLRGAGLRVVERPGWKSRTHFDDDGDPIEMTDVLGVTCHHTASGRGTGTTLGLNTVENGRTGLRGPLAHLYLNREGTFYVVAAGICWHAGKSTKPKYLNEHRIGIEALAAGDGWSQDWPEAQMKAYAAGCAALADHYHFPVNEVRGHKETCEPQGRKVDPSFSMTGFRSMVESALATQRRGIKETTMEKTDKLVVGESGAKQLGKKSATDTVTVEYALLWGGARGAQLRGDTVKLSKQLAALQATANTLLAAVSALAAQSPEGVRAAFEEGRKALRQDLAELDVRVVLGDDDETSGPA